MLDLNSDAVPVPVHVHVFCLQVPIERVKLVAAEKPILLSQSSKTIKEAAAKLPKS